MVSDYRGSYGGPSNHDRYIRQELGRMQHQFVEGDQHGQGSHPQPQPHANTHPHPLALAQSHDLQGAIHREIEKERIRQEIIMSEILRRRALEAEVRRELMVERELALHGGSNGFHFGSASPMELDLPMRLPFVDAEGRFLEERMMLSLTQVDNLSNRRESRLSESLQFQSASDNARSLVKPVLEGVREKKKINLQAKAMVNITGAARAIENITGAKRALSGSDAGESEYSNLKKKTKEWSCNICQVSASSERGLNEHLQGKKHKTKEAAPRAQNTCKTYSIGLYKKEVAKSIAGSGTADPGTNNEVKFTSEPLPFSKSGDANSGTDDQPLQENLNSDSLRKNESAVPHKVKKNDREYRFWCEICQVGVLSQHVMDMHKMGKKHRRKVVRINRRGGVFPSRKDEVGEKAMAEDAGAVKETPEQDAVGIDKPVSPKMPLGC